MIARQGGMILGLQIACGVSPEESLLRKVVAPPSLLAVGSTRGSVQGLRLRRADG